MLIVSLILHLQLQIGIEFGVQVVDDDDQHRAGVCLHLVLQAQESLPGHEVGMVPELAKVIAQPVGVDTGELRDVIVKATRVLQPEAIGQVLLRGPVYPSLLVPSRIWIARPFPGNKQVEIRQGLCHPWRDLDRLESVLDTLHKIAGHGCDT